MPTPKDPIVVEVPAFVPSSSPRRIAFVGEAPGADEEKEGIPFVGRAGQLLNTCLLKAGISRPECMFTNVFNVRPPGNAVEWFCARKKEVGKDYMLPLLSTGNYVKPEHLHHLDRLKQELTDFKPNLVIALGNTPLWALCRVTGIGKYRGSIMESTLVAGQKVFPTWHPAGVLRAYDNKVILITDLIKAESESHYPEIRRMKRYIWIYPTLGDMALWKTVHGVEGGLLSVDIETKGRGMISCIGFSFDKINALVVPFWDSLREGNSYWPTVEKELAAWSWVKCMLEEFPCEKLGQNFVAFDTWVMLAEKGIFPRHIAHDTMLEQHAQQPEMEKKLGFLTSIFCDEPAYKQLRPRGWKTTKREE
jgi:DNA polymerase